MTKKATIRESEEHREYSDRDYTDAARRITEGVDDRLEIDRTVTREVSVSRFAGGAYVCCWYRVDDEMVEEMKYDEEGNYAGG